MKIRNATFVIGAVSKAQYPETGWPEFALCGRSNVGKSSFINRFLNRKSLARTSSQPGKTQQLNYYAVEADIGSFYFVDLPGYGYAKVSKSERAKWGTFIENYLLERRACVRIFHVLDIRHAPSQDDIDMYAWMVYHQIPVRVIATKADKISKGKVKAHGDRIKKTLGVRDGDILAISSENGMGFQSVTAEVEEQVQAYHLTHDAPTPPLDLDMP